jgi:DNA-binding GntR family transcriptional regulator
MRAMKSDRNDQQRFAGRLIPAGHAVDRTRPLAGQIYELLRDAIITMSLQPNDVIFEKILAESLGVSRTPVREALQQLAREELVVIAAQSGTFVAPVTRAQFMESFLIRRVLEAASIRHAAEIITPAEIEQLNDIHEAHSRAVARGNTVASIAHDNAFHSCISRAAKLPRLYQLAGMARAPIDRVRHVTAREPNEGTMTLRQHQKVIDALTRHDPDATEHALLEHLDDAFERQKRVFDQHEEIFEGDSASLKFPAGD